ncbi:hypothetical protein [Primorskyibacter flagellatus]|uniref:Uncharacterized protein n=1 Tax=Primorskyibacter flagellatus TaxID=1387277 RepID=A0A1W1YXG2_9RHOB|nr:hypothetical protein [Primorskyibacter flagellatus]SMC40885.1 hypothetical protein SAMN06295998_10161 [Primorskyibacter flagellatus]
MKGDAIDPKGLIQESYRIEGISLEECRSIFMDWALALPVDADTSSNIGLLLDRYASGRADHPMTQVLTEGLAERTTARRRGGWRGRRQSS